MFKVSETALPLSNYFPTIFKSGGAVLVVIAKNTLNYVVLGILGYSAHKISKFCYMYA